jgi:hypothetical protein
MIDAKILDALFPKLFEEGWDLKVTVSSEPDKDGFYEAVLKTGSTPVRALSRKKEAAVAYVLQEIAKNLLKD